MTMMMILTIMCLLREEKEPRKDCKVQRATRAPNPMTEAKAEREVKPPKVLRVAKGQRVKEQTVQYQPSQEAKVARAVRQQLEERVAPRVVKEGQRAARV